MWWQKRGLVYSVNNLLREKRPFLQEKIAQKGNIHTFSTNKTDIEPVSTITHLYNVRKNHILTTLNP